MGNEDRILDFVTLNVTKDELFRRGELNLQAEVDRILNNNVLEKPKLHSRMADQTTTYYEVDLSIDDIDRIVTILLDREVDFVEEKQEHSSNAVFYATIVEEWSKFLL